MNNRIPRNTKKIVGKMLVDTSCNRAGDIVHFTREEQDFIGYNPRTEQRSFTFIGMLRNSNIVEFLEVTQ